MEGPFKCKSQLGLASALLVFIDQIEAYLELEVKSMRMSTCQVGENVTAILFSVVHMDYGP